MAKEKFSVFVNALTADATPDPAADYLPSYDASATTSKKVLMNNIFAAFQQKGSDVASAGTITLGQGEYFFITGTTTITDIDFTTDFNGRKAWLKFNGILTLTHNGTSLILPTAANITTAAGDVALFVSEGSDNIRCLYYQRASGAALTGAGGTAASTTEVLTGTDSAKFGTPDAIAALWEQGADIASAATISIGEGGYFFITGTTTITDVDFATDKTGRRAWLKFNGILTLTHNSSTLILPTGANITTAAGDTAEFISEGSDAVRCVSYTRASGAALAGSGGITNSAGNNVIPKSDGTNIVASRLTDDGTNITVAGGKIMSSTGNDLVFQNPAAGGNEVQQKDAFGNIGTKYGDTRRFVANKIFATSSITPTQITANQNDYKAGDADTTIWRISSDAARNITGIAGPAFTSAGALQDGERRLLVNVGSFNITLKHQDAGSTAGNRFLNSTAADIVLAADQAADLHYDNVTTRWRVYKKN